MPLVDKEDPPLEEIRAGWKKPIRELAAFSAKHDKPILFTEVGYKSTKDSGIEPWTWPERRMDSNSRSQIYSAETQANLYQALFLEVWDEPWLAGFHFWKWYPQKPKLNTANNSTNIDFTPQNKPVEDLIRAQYSAR